MECRMSREKIFEDVAERMNLYFIFGGNDNFKSFNDAFLKANFTVKEEKPEYIEGISKEVEKRIKREPCFNEVAYEIWRRKRSDFERERKRC
jgi:hypothetical protein